MQPPAAGDWILFGGTQIQESPRRRLIEQPIKLTFASRDLGTVLRTNSTACDWNAL